MQIQVPIIRFLLLSSSITSATLLADVNPKADNSKVNKELWNQVKTADDQSSAQSDVEQVRKIRDALTNDKSLSTYAHNIKIVTQEDTILLKGPVRSTAEKLRVEAIAAKHSFGRTFTSLLTISAN